MGRRKKGRPVSGWVNLDKPVEITSTSAVSRVRRLLDAQKAGHAGTLDPLATGILPIALGEATKTIPFIQDRKKEYSFRIVWGEQRDTDDAEGAVIATSDHRPGEKAILSVLDQFTGQIEQMPPAYSALKIDGERAYDLARKGETPDLKARPVIIETLKLTACDPDGADFTCLCGKGTYMRSLARDIALQLGTVGYITDLRRHMVGPFTLKNAISLAKLEEIINSAAPEDIDDNVLLPVETALDDIPALALTDREAARLKNGQVLQFISRPDIARLSQAGFTLEAPPREAKATLNGKLIALIEVKAAQIKPARVFNF